MIRKRTKKNGKTVYDTIIYDDQGKQRWKTLPTLKEAKAYEGSMTKAKYEGRLGEVLQVDRGTTTTFAQLAEKYRELYQVQPSWATCKVHVVAALVREFGTKKLASITRLELEQWRQKRCTKANGTPRKKSSVDQDMAHFRHMLNKAKEWGLLRKSPFDHGSSLFYKPDNARKQYATQEQLTALLQACGATLGLIVEVAILTGLRKANVLGLRWEWVDLKEGLINIPAHCMKAKREHRLPINDRLAEILRELRRKHGLRSPWVFSRENGDQVGDPRKSFRKALKAAGLENFRFHDLRHTFASHLIMGGVDLVTVGSLLGHADIKTTMRYAHISQEHRRTAVNVLNSLPGIRQGLDKAAAE